MINGDKMKCNICSFETRHWKIMEKHYMDEHSIPSKLRNFYKNINMMMNRSEIILLNRQYKLSEEIIRRSRKNLGIKYLKRYEEAVENDM